MKDAIDNSADLTREEIEGFAHTRVSEITKEFTEGFRFIEDYPKSVTFFGANQFHEDNPYYQDARALAGKIVDELGYAVFSGGGPGIMEAANKGAFEAGGDSLGLLIELPDGQVTNDFISDSFSSYYFFVRKVLLSFSSEAFIFYPGGFGTLDEFFEILTLIQTKKISGVPLICVGSEYWNELQNFVDKELLARGTITEEDNNLFVIVDDHDVILDLIKEVPIRASIPVNEALRGNRAQAQKMSLAEKHCKPCEGEARPLSAEASGEFIEKVDNWTIEDFKKLSKVLVFKDFAEALEFVNKVGKIAEEENHHPNIGIFDYKKVRIVLYTHAIDGLSENDFILAAKIDELRR